jgi:hypothetical protein
VTFLWACLGLAAASVGTGLWLAFTASQAAAGLPLGEGLDAAVELHDLVEALQALAFIAAVVAWLTWSARAYGNLRLFGTRQARHTTAWVLGAWFVPFANLVKPYQVVKELWVRSRDGNATKEASDDAGTGLLAGWWAAWIAMNVVSQISTKVTEQAHGVDAVRSAALLGAVANAATVGAALAALLVVKRIDGLQRAAMARAHAAEVFT